MSKDDYGQEISAAKLGKLDEIDLGAIQCGLPHKPKTFVLETERGEASYRLIIEAKKTDRRHSVRLYRCVGAEYALENLASYPDVIGYVLIRALSRGIGEAEHFESETTVVINFGRMPLQP